MRGEPTTVAEELKESARRIAHAIVASNTERAGVIEGIRDSFVGSLEKPCSECGFHPPGNCPGCLTRMRVLAELDEYLEQQRLPLAGRAA
jgi:rubrerythrin